ncbi:ArsR/SmtB family transcription factor [Herpetosiphon geysericola]|uniref:Transcriptional regulator n=1 Tax=Herpetosiphon geysericola TaxID=70996 RepID=A0A0P6Y5Y5_9CHLR|nr:metalloregulator ArsR/SmtB family transcription factor [Herpetosiphon geysericola]KPL84901.1 transcriptional regulator [Herpetosiphon geysericola]
MARAATTTDVFNAIAEPGRRQILDLLANGELSVNELVEQLGLAQPQVSKRLHVLREVGLVLVRDDGRQRHYRLNGRALKPVHDWIRRYEQMWNDRFDALDDLLEELDDQED